MLAVVCRRCNEWRGPSPRLSAWVTQLRRSIAAVANRWRRCANLTGLGIEPRPPAPRAVAAAPQTPQLGGAHTAKGGPKLS